MSEQGIREPLCFTCSELKQLPKYTPSVSAEIAGIAKCIGRTENRNDIKLYGVTCWNWNSIQNRAFTLCWNKTKLFFLTHPWITYSMEKSPFEKLIGSQLVKKFPAFYGTRRFITAFTNARHLSLSWASSIQFMPPHLTSWRFLLTLSSHLRLDLPSGILLSGFPTKNSVHAYPLPHTCYIPHLSHSSGFDHPNNTGWGVQIIKLLIM
jgi:hypothetical protein